jgi:hypothetical protein
MIMDVAGDEGLDAGMMLRRDAPLSNGDGDLLG